MGKSTGLKSPSFTLRRVSSHVRARSQRAIEVESTLDFLSNSGESNLSDHDELESSGGDQALGRRIMVVIDSTVEAKCALQWTLSHSVLNQDTILLVSITKFSKQGKKPNRKTYELLQTMKDLCVKERPKVYVEIAVVEGKEKGPTIVNEAKKQGVSLLVLGQRKRSMVWRAAMMWRRNRSGGNGVAEHCIKNANCMTVAVRKKRSMGGYLITTRRHKDFWLLA